MSTTLLGTSYVIEVDTTTSTATSARGTDANYKVVACLTSNGVEVSNASQDISNKCDGGFASSTPGLGSSTFSGDGQAVSLTEDEEEIQVNYQNLLALAVNKTVFFLRMTNAANTIVREGKVWISSYSETAPNAEAYTFTVTFQVTGELFIIPAV